MQVKYTCILPWSDTSINVTETNGTRRFQKRQKIAWELRLGSAFSSYSLGPGKKGLFPHGSLQAIPLFIQLLEGFKNLSVKHLIGFHSS
jgi:hypothetical protein